MYVALHLSVLLSAAHVASTTTLHPLAVVFIILNISCSGAAGFSTAHELIHSKHKVDRLIADVLLASLCYMHWAHSHIAHHKQVATPGDPSSAWFKETVRDHHDQWFTSTRYIDYVTPNIIDFYYLKYIFSGTKYPRNSLFRFEHRSTDHDSEQRFNQCLLSSYLNVFFS